MTQPKENRIIEDIRQLFPIELKIVTEAQRYQNHWATKPGEIVPDVADAFAIIRSVPEFSNIYFIEFQVGYLISEYGVITKKTDTEYFDENYIIPYSRVLDAKLRTDVWRPTIENDTRRHSQ